MSNGQPNVLMGRQQQQPGMYQQQQQQQTGQVQQQQNPLRMLQQHASHYAGSMNNVGTNMTSLYNYGNSKTNYVAILGLEDNVTEEQMRAQAVQEGSMVASQLAAICINRREGNQFYIIWQQALKRFEHPVMNGPTDPEFVGFVNQVKSNVALNNYILTQAAIQYSGEAAYLLLKGDVGFDQNQSHPMRNPEKIKEVFYRCCIDTLNLQFYDFLSSNPAGCEIYYRLPAHIKAVLIERENQIFDMVMQKYVFTGSECPYKKVDLTSIGNKFSHHNPILDYSVTAVIGGDESKINGLYGVNFAQQNNPQDLAQMNRWVAQKAQENAAEHLGYIQNNTREVPQYNDNGYDREEVKITDITDENRHRFNINAHATNIPGTEWYLLKEYTDRDFFKGMVMDDGIPFRSRDARSPGCVTVWRFDWMAKTYNFRLVPYPPMNKLYGETAVNKLISNPEELLPFMFEEHGVQKTTFNPKDMESEEFVREGFMEPMGTMKTLDKKPDILVASKPTSFNQGNDYIVERLDGVTTQFDKKGQLDAFVLPSVLTREYIMEHGTNMDRFYASFRSMVHGNDEGIKDTGRVLKGLRYSWEECESEDFRSFLEPYLTNLVNRWLVEVRGYAESKKEYEDNNGNVPGLRTSNIFDDLEDIIDYLGKNDPATLRAFLDYENNSFIRGGIEIIAPQDVVRKEVEERHAGEEEDSMKKMVMELDMRTVYIRRNTIFINVNKMNGPAGTEMVTIKESGDPRFFAIVRRAMKAGIEKFGDHAEVFVKFNQDQTVKVWALSPSGINPESVFNLRLMSQGCNFVHAMPIG
jgi:hypothetical protein